MSPKSVPSFTICDLEYDELLRSDDKTVFSRLEFILRTTKKRLCPKSVRHDDYKVTRGLACVTIHLYMGKTETASFSFVPPPEFQRD